MRAEDKLKTLEAALEKLLRDDAAEGINFTPEERKLVIAALEVCHEIITTVLDARKP